MNPSDVVTEYDVEVIQEQADLLYAQADRALVTNTIVLGVLGVLAGAASFNFLAEHSEALAIVLSLGIPIGAAVGGGMLGSAHAFKLRAQAQQLLVLVAIERNTRKVPAAPSHS